ncbi:signal peptidase I [Enterococcus rivorum]|uniref:Signal peptidase I n=2 Tax=Enterococcus rivorum TaxID=762845 RepID=A0A1E5KSC1_9ENTE|nr:signal peptidase I [Enterococcus rivorum]MBP2097413.1 signal peptidase I [Enterococcus rivorum]OEH80761.1 signal peptidase I [Enterococcus rivorum]
MSEKKQMSSHSRPNKKEKQKNRVKASSSHNRKNKVRTNQSNKNSDLKKRKNVKKRKRPLGKNKTIQKQKRKKRMKRTLVELAVSVGIFGVLLTLFSIFVFSFTKVQGYSMTPTLSDGEWLFINRLAKPKRFKMVIYKDPKSRETSVRRVVGLPGETIYYKKDQLYVNDRDVYERYLEIEVQRAKNSKSLFTEDWTPSESPIPKGKYLVLGDNRPYASDSREYGYIDEKAIVGVVEMRVMPIHQLQQF